MAKRRLDDPDMACLIDMMPAPLVLDDTAVAYLIGVAVARASGLHHGPVVCPSDQVFGGRMVK